ncbi:MULTISPECIES: hypothetical protein [Olivibacter]|uniref:Uncharacterized protein n=1 Tax=Olivibacter jilunii TaxID=985016 RepID=A0ABW6AYW6_9SPHI
MKLKDYTDIITEFGAQDPVLNHSQGDESVFYRTPEKAQSMLADFGVGKYICFIAPYEKNGGVNKGEGGVWKKQGMILFLSQVEMDNPESELEVLDQCEQLSDRLFSYLYRQRGVDERVFGIDLSHWSCDYIGPVGQNHYGYVSYFELKDPIQL